MSVSGGIRRVVLAGAALLALLLAGPAHARQAPPSLAGEIALDVDQFGVGGVARPGDWCGIRVRVTDSSPKQREVIVQISVPDADSDHLLVQREITTNPGVPLGTWLYLRLPTQSSGSYGLDVAAYEAIETSGAAGPRVGRLLGTGRLLAKQVVEQSTGLLAVLGPKDFGLRRYSARATSNSSYAMFGHEVTEVLSGLNPTDLPDRWTGLAPFEVIVWGQGSPGDLRAERASALKEWVQRGGHLVIILPAVGETWTNPQASELHDLLPAVSVNRHEGVDLAPYRPILSYDTRFVPPKNSVVYELTPTAGAAPGEAMRVFNGPRGECVVARRLYGAGAVTLVGLDLNNRELSDREGLEPALFWHRVLGRRGILPTQKQILEDLKGSVPVRGQEVEFDNEIAGMISKPGAATLGVLTGLVVFLTYWGVAGPLGFALLKKQGWVRHAWVAFVLAGAAFTGIAWGGAMLIREKSVQAEHVTLVDHVFGQPVERARAWLSVLVPWYGDATLAIGDPKDRAGERSEFTNLLTPWDPPDSNGRSGSFPDARGYRSETRAPSHLTVPARQTVKQFQADWAGGPVWKMPFPAPNADGTPQTLSAKVGAVAPESCAQGSLVHDLPGVLKDVLIVVVARQRPLSNTTMTNARLPMCEARVFSKTGDWAPGEVLDLAADTRLKAGDANANDAAAFFRRLRDKGVPLQDNPYQSGRQQQQAPRTGSDDVERLEGLAFFSQLEPPVPEEAGPFGRGAPIARRRLTHTWDLGRWFTQPCIIIVGRLGDDRKKAPCPIPLTVNGEKLPTEGTTIVRWVYPLPDNPPALKRDAGNSQPDEPADGSPEDKSGR